MIEEKYRVMLAHTDKEFGLQSGEYLITVANGEATLAYRQEFSSTFFKSLILERAEE